MKTFKVKPAEVFALQFTDGTKVKMTFNTKAMSILAEQINNNKITLTGPDFFSALIYSGAKSCNEDFTIEEANAMYVTLEESCPDALNGIVEEYCKATGVDSENLKKKAILQIITKQ